MARKNVLRYQLLEAQSLAANFTSEPTDVRFLDNFSYQINVVTTNSEGTFTVQGSNDYEANNPAEYAPNPGNWFDLTLSGVPSVAAANDVILISINQMPFKAIRIKYNSTVAGTGVADVWVVSKQIGG